MLLHSSHRVLTSMIGQITLGASLNMLARLEPFEHQDSRLRWTNGAGLSYVFGLPLRRGDLHPARSLFCMVTTTQVCP
jgi:hypothetical protein